MTQPVFNNVSFESVANAIGFELTKPAGGSDYIQNPILISLVDKHQPSQLVRNHVSSPPRNLFPGNVPEHMSRNEYSQLDTPQSRIGSIEIRINDARVKTVES